MEAAQKFIPIFDRLGKVVTCTTCVAHIVYLSCAASPLRPIALTA
jgi:hypothetical protein